MPVVIHDFEVVSEPAPRPAPATPPAGESTAADPRRTAALLRTLVRQQERLARLRAH